MKTGIPQFMGVRVKRREDPALITGEGKYVADTLLEGSACMSVVRSPHAHARIRRVDTSAAKDAPGVLGAFTAEEINSRLAKPLPVLLEPVGGEFHELRITERYPLAMDRVRCVGDPVAVVVAESAYAAVDALEKITIDYEPLTAVTDAEISLGEGAPRIHQEWPDNRAFVWTLQGGDVDRAFAEAKATVELRARIQRVIPNAMEPRAVAARYDAESDQWTMWSSTQIPHLVRADVAAILGISERQLRVIAPEVGGGFGAKCNVYGEEVLVPLLARMLGRPVKWFATRSEDFVCTAHGRDQIDTLRLAADAEGRVTAVDLTVLADVGAYHSRVSPCVPPFTGLMMTGVYKIPNARAQITGVFTNKAIMEPYRGAGRPEAAYLIERAMDLLAGELDLDPAELRRRNFVPPSEFPYTTPTGLKYDSGEYRRALEKALELVGYERLRAEQAKRRSQDGKLLGIGLSCYVEICGFGPWEAGFIAVGPEGKASVLTGTCPTGQGHQTSWAQIAAEILQMPLEDIEVKYGDTAIVPRGIGTFGSRSAPVGGSAILQSADAVREGAREIAAHLLEAAVADVVLEKGKFQVVGVPARTISWKELAAEAYSDHLPEELKAKLKAESDFTPLGETYPFGVHLCVVEVDPETGQIEIVRYLTVDDCGKVINPLLVEGQIHGGIAQGIGQALLEEARYDSDGNLSSGSLMDYALPKAHQLPSFDANRTETPTPLNGLGVKGVGEAATIGSTPAIVNAVIDALSHRGVRHIDTPLTPEKIWKAMNGRPAP